MNPSDLKQLAEQISVPINHLQYILEQLESYIPDATVWVFGSRIKGSNRPASDLDLAVLCDKKLPKSNYPNSMRYLSKAIYLSKFSFLILTACLPICRKISKLNILSFMKLR